MYTFNGTADFLQKKVPGKEVKERLGEEGEVESRKKEKKGELQHVLFSTVRLLRSKREKNKMDFQYLNFFFFWLV